MSGPSSICTICAGSVGRAAPANGDQRREGKASIDTIATGIGLACTMAGRC